MTTLEALAVGMLVGAVLAGWGAPAAGRLWARLTERKRELGRH